MSSKWKHIRGMEEDPANGRSSDKPMRLPNVASSLEAAYTAAGQLYYDTDNTRLRAYVNGAWATLSTSAGAGDNTLDDAYDQGGAGAGRAITADSGAIAITVSDNSNNAALTLTQSDVTNNPAALTFANTGTGDDITGTSDTWSISPAGAATFASATITSATITSMTLGSVDGFTLSGDCVFTTSATTGNGLYLDGSSVTSGDVLQIEADAATLSGGNILNLTVDGTSVFDVDEDGSTTISGTASSDALTLTAGDISLSNGTLNITANAGDAIDVTPVTTGAVLDVSLPAAYNLATGAIDIDGSTGSGSIIDVDLSGAYTGDVVNINMTNAVGAQALVLTGAGTRTVSLIEITDTPEGASANTLDMNITPAAGTTQVLDIDIAGTDDADILCINFAAAYTGDAISLDMSNAVGAKALDITGAGTRTASLVHITDTPETAGTALDLDVTPAAGCTTAAIDMDIAGTDDADVVSIDFAGAYTGDALNITTTNMGAAGQAIVVDGSIANSGAIVSLSTSGISTAAGSVLSATSSTQPAAANDGVVARFIETGAAQATTYAVNIDSTNNEALHVDAGVSMFDESLSCLGAASTFTAGPNFVQAAGAANAITATLNDVGGTAVVLTDGLRLIIDLNSRTLQAGANTLDLNGGGAVSIVSHYNPASNIGTAYVANGIVELVYNGTSAVWMDMSQ